MNINDLMEYCAKARFNIEMALDTSKGCEHNLINDGIVTDLEIALKKIKNIMNKFDDSWVEGE